MIEELASKQWEHKLSAFPVWYFSRDGTHLLKWNCCWYKKVCYQTKCSDLKLAAFFLTKNTYSCKVCSVSCYKCLMLITAMKYQTAESLWCFVPAQACPLAKISVVLTSVFSSYLDIMKQCRINGTEQE